MSALARIAPVACMCALAGACAAAPLAARPVTPGAATFTVATYNVYFREPGGASTLDAIARADADVVCLQEVNRAWARAIAARHAAAYEHALFRTEEGAGGYAVLSRRPVEDLGLLDAPHHPAWRVRAETPIGDVEILVVHLRAHFKGAGGPIRAALRVADDHAADIARFAAASGSGARPLLVVGDFNEEAGGAAVAFLRRRGLRDVLPLFRPGQPTYRHRRAFAGQLDAAIDHILAGPDLRPLDAYVLPAGGSDHFPVVARFERGR